ncbi:MAG TPA: hypothetical protein VJJ21_02955 [Candidatus Nanoarchaeia archaeon]|nr:hypothetical protein [Candidatus Nanoarchaeia archaeon]
MAEGIFSKDKSEVKRALLNGMVHCAEYVEEYYESGYTLTHFIFLDGCPDAFRPSVADKFLFGKLIDNIIDNIMSEDRRITNQWVSGMSILGRYYYPNYR